MNLYALMRLAAPPARAARPPGKRTRVAAARTRTWPFGGRGGAGTRAGAGIEVGTRTGAGKEPPYGV